MDVTLIQCTNTKRGTVGAGQVFRAEDLYDESRYFRRMKEWANARGNPWYIMSAKHGLVAPGELISPYDERGISKSQAIEMALKLDGIGVDRVDVTAGRGYTRHLIPELEQDGIEVVNHFAGERIGDRERLLAEATEQLRE